MPLLFHAIANSEGTSSKGDSHRALMSEKSAVPLTTSRV